MIFCKEKDCDRAPETKVGYCIMHYKRWKRNGTTNTVIRTYAHDFVCEACGEAADKYRNGLCNACRVRKYKKGYTDRDNRRPGSGGINCAGYMVITTPAGREYEHRVRMQNHLGRKLLPGEVIHHKDGDKLNNEIENLELLPSQSAHMKLHK